MEAEDTELQNQSKEVILFGRDIRKVPCFKNSILFGIYSGLATGLATFMFTSRVKLASNVAMGSYVSVALGYYFFCRYTYVKNKYDIAEIQQALRHKHFSNDEENMQSFLQDDEKLEDA
ncbi:PREDICTED: cytochrome c oxidase protein 20 homolog isoform X1 [Dinoponera quadriceps]|uniref:Cytochrome c oxidase assembly protein COX20, mitochondrial n=1 Tax=Dinoponera quadriceps TaxID=609295 RepID=A0A6P3X7J6_DINQU|nr:PREDICTED: cytochrome c oxidase protein 20 homolog isoform X1 [Dinoponera quadriceps]